MPKVLRIRVYRIGGQEGREAKVPERQPERGHPARA